MDAFELEVVFDSDPVTKEIEALLNDHNNKTGMMWNPEPITVVSRDRSGRLVGGLTGSTNFGWLHIRLLAVHPTLHGKGCGRKLVEMAEAEARKRECRFAHVDTFSFQALPFYEMLGYEVFGSLEDYPSGHTRYYLRKRL